MTRSGAADGRFEARRAFVVWRPPAGPESRPDLELLVTTRVGGCSVGPYASLNLSPATGDADDAVLANRSRLSRALDMPPAWGLLHQVHAADVVRCAAKGDSPAADGQWTDQAGEALIISVADCAPVFVWDVHARRVALVHAGWRGTAAGVVRHAVETLCTAGSQVFDLRVAIGPCIGPCCYEVGEEVAARIPDSTFTDPAGRLVLDLRAANATQAVGAGIDPAHVFDTPPCTHCNAEFFYSHRRDGSPTGRMWAIAWFR